MRRKVNIYVSTVRGSKANKSTVRGSKATSQLYEVARQTSQLHYTRALF